MKQFNNFKNIFFYLFVFYGITMQASIEWCGSIEKSDSQDIANQSVTLDDFLSKIEDYEAAVEYGPEHLQLQHHRNLCQAYTTYSTKLKEKRQPIFPRIKVCAR